MRKFTYFYSLLLTALFLLPWSGIKAAETISPESPYTTGFETDAVYSIPANWTKVSGDAYYPDVESGSASYAGSHHLYFTGGQSSPVMLIALPEFSLEPQHLDLAFYYKTGSSTYSADMSVGYIEDVTDASSYHSLQTLSYTTDYVKQSLSLSSVPDGARIAFYLKGTNSTKKGKLYLDAITVSTTYVPTPTGCTTPTDLAAEATSSTSAMITWSQAATESAWQLRYREKDTESWSDIIDVEANSKSLEGLATDKTYEVQVRSNCGEGDENKSDWSTSAEFTLASCPAVSNVTLSNKLYNKVTVNWTTTASASDVRYSTDGGTNWSTPIANIAATSQEVSVAVGNTYTFQVKPSCGDDETWVAAGETYAPAFPIPAPSASDITDAQATVSWSALLDNPNYKYIRVDAGSDAPDAAAWASAASTAETSVTLTGLIGGTGYDVYVRAVYAGGESEPAKATFTTIKIAPTDLVQGTTTTNSIAFSWSYAGAATQFEWRCNSTSWTTTTETSAVATGLSAGETYTFEVRAYYADGIYSTILYTSFNTACEAKALPYSCGFENSDEDVFTTNGYNVCWKKIGSPAATTQIIYKHSGSRGLYVGGTEEQYVILPEFENAVKGMQISFWYKNYYPTYSPSTLVLGSMTDPTDASTFTTIKTLGTADNTFVQIVEQSLAAAGASDHYIAFKYTGEQGASAVALDDISVTILPSCPKPSDVTIQAENITSTTAKVSWTNGGSESAWKIQTSNDGTTWGEEIAADSNPFTLTELTPNMTTYYVRVKADCGGGDESKWSNVSAPFQTKCLVAAALGYEEGFEDFSTGSYASTGLSCWAELNASHTQYSYPQMYVNTNTKYVQHGSKSLYFVSSNKQYIYAILPEFSGAYTGLQLTFSHKEESSSGSGHFTLGYMTDVTDASTFVAITSEAYTRATSWNTETENIGSVPTGARLAFRYGGASNNFYAGIDDISITEVPACATPTAIVGGNETANSAQISWTNGGEETAWKLQYTTVNPASAVDGDWISVNSGNAISTKPYTLEDLAESTVYYARVKAVCDGESESSWSVASAGFLTDCNPKTVTELAPWIEGFESEAADEMPACWERIEAYSGHGYPRVLDGSSYASDGGSKCLYFYCPSVGTGNTAYTETAILPTFNEEIKNLQITFDYKSTEGTKYGQLVVGYVDPSNGNAFTPVQPLDQTDSYTTPDLIEMPDNAPDGARIAIRCIGGNSGTNYTTRGYVDLIVVSLKPSCPAPTGLTAVATSDGANVSWTDDNASEWKLQYSIKDADSWTEVDNISATNYTLTGLSTANIYEVQVKAVCGAGNESAWTASAEFQPVCNAPTSLTFTARTQNSATFSWTSSESTWKLQYKAEGDADWSEENVNTNPFTLTGLSAGTTYQAQICLW